jgi:hypothetical protein
MRRAVGAPPLAVPPLGRGARGREGMPDVPGAERANAAAPAR